MRRSRVTSVLLVVLLVAMINLPIVQITWTDWRVESQGVDVRADVIEVNRLPPVDDPHYVLSFRFPVAIDPEQSNWNAEVDRATYDWAAAENTVAVRVLEDRPSAYTVAGEVSSRVGLYVTLVADLALLLVVLLFRRSGVARRPSLKAVAAGAVEPAEPGSVLERLEDGLHLIRGEVVEIGDDEVVLDLGERSVHVLLDGHPALVGLQQTAQVRGRLIG